MDPKITPGQLKHYIQILHFVDVSDGAGGTKPTEAPLKNVWAKLDDITGNETEDGKIIALNVRKYTIRYDDDIVADGEKMAVNAPDGVYDIHSIAQIGFKNYLVFKCSKRE